MTLVSKVLTYLRFCLSKESASTFRMRGLSIKKLSARERYAGIPDINWLSISFLIFAIIFIIFLATNWIPLNYYPSSSDWVLILQGVIDYFTRII